MNLSSSNKMSENTTLKPSLLSSSKLAFDNIKPSGSVFKKSETYDDIDEDIIKSIDEVPKPIIPQATTPKKFVFGQSLFKTRLLKAKVDEKKEENNIENKNGSKSIFGESCIPEISKELGIENPELTASSILKSFADKKDTLSSVKENAKSGESKNNISYKDKIAFEKIEPAAGTLDDDGKKDFEPVDIKTGEENEYKIFSMQFTKIFQFDRIKKNWNEKGAGELRINKSVNDDGKEVARIITRTGANRRVIINSPPFAGMYCEMVTKTRVKFTAQSPDSDIPGLFLVNSTASVISNFCENMENEFKVNVIYPPEETAASERKRPADSDNEEDETVCKKKSS
uniref:RanBD1 domain-containing protein n=1 Tax=Parastrongyloides trichosuri TaxID=131310 RepID=A0A0N4Z8W1_PARTI